MSFIFIGLVIYNFSNIELQHTFGKIAIVLIYFILLKVTLFIEICVVFALLIIPFIFLYLIYEEIVKGWL